MDDVSAAAPEELSNSDEEELENEGLLQAGKLQKPSRWQVCENGVKLVVS